MTRDNTPQTMKEISHTPPDGASVTNVWKRGNEPAVTDEPPADD